MHTFGSPEVLYPPPATLQCLLCLKDVALVRYIDEDGYVRVKVEDTQCLDK